MDQEYIDKDLGRIVFIQNNKAKNIIVRRKSDYIRVTIPHFYTQKEAVLMIEEFKPRLLKMTAKPVLNFYPQMEFSTFSFFLSLEQSNTLQNYYYRLSDGILSITCPQNIIFESDKNQKYIRTIIEKTLRSEAKRILPKKVAHFAEIHNFTFNEVKINKSATRWGSCSSKKNINLSYTCMLLPEHLADFVILHELCHTVEMNHGERFWALLDKVSGNKARVLTQELKQKQINW